MPVPLPAESSLDSLIQAAVELLPLLDQTILRLRYSQTVPGLSPLEYRILEYACYHGPVRVGDISAMSGLSFPNASRYIKDLVAKGLLATERDQADRRVQLVQPSATGRDLLGQIESGIRAEAAVLLGAVGLRERSELEGLCRSLAAALRPLSRTMMEATPSDSWPNPPDL